VRDLIAFAPIFSNHAVLQRNRKITVWGEFSADSFFSLSSEPMKCLSGNAPGDLSAAIKLLVYSKDDEQRYHRVCEVTKTVSADRFQTKSPWEISLPPQPAGGPYTMIVMPGCCETVFPERFSEELSGHSFEEFIPASQIISDIWFGDVYLCAGQSNMEYRLRDDSDYKSGKPVDFNYPLVRSFRAPRIDYEGAEAEDCAGNNTWSILSRGTAGDFSAVSFFFAARMYEHTGVPVGLIDVNRGGTSAACWVDEACLRSDPEIRLYLDEYNQLLSTLDVEQNKKDHESYYAVLARYREAAKQCAKEGLATPEIEKKIGPYPWPPPSGPFAYRSPCKLFHTMLEPCIPYAILAVLFYQGEEDVNRNYLYKNLLHALITSWRDLWNCRELEFILVQTAPFDDPEDTRMAAAYLRETQSEIAAEVPGVTMVVTTDCGEKDDIHPKSKRLIGERLFRKACRHLLNEEMAADSPRYISSYAAEGRMYMEFDTRCGTLQVGIDQKGETLLGFYLAGADGIFYPADASVYGKIVIAGSDRVASPLFVRYAFGRYVPANLYSSGGIPAEPFRTDCIPFKKQ